MARTPVLSPGAPAPSGGYSQGIVAGGFLFLVRPGPVRRRGRAGRHHDRRAGAPGAREPRRGGARSLAARCTARCASACTSATWRTSTRWTPPTGTSSPTRCRPGRRSSPTSWGSTSRVTRSSGSTTDVDVASLDTPVATVDLDAVERNIARMQGYCDEHGLAFRPHIKTHKLPSIAHMQVRAGAVGITCQKLGEAEVMQAAGLQDILLSFPLVGAMKAERLAALAGEAIVSVVGDSDVVARGLSPALARAGTEVGFLVECDTGFLRTGVQTPAGGGRSRGARPRAARSALRRADDVPDTPRHRGVAARRDRRDQRTRAGGREP